MATLLLSNRICTVWLIIYRLLKCDVGKNNGLGVQEGINRIKLVQVNMNNALKLVQFEKTTGTNSFGLKIIHLYSTIKV